MQARTRARLSYANVTATLALFLALTGGIAWALDANSVRSEHIVNGQVKGADVAERTLRGVNAASVNGVKEQEIFAQLPVPETTSGAPRIVVFEEGGVQLRLSCFHPSSSPSDTMAQLLADPHPPKIGTGVLTTHSVPDDQTDVDSFGSDGGFYSAAATTQLASGELVYRTQSGITTTFTFEVRVDQDGFGTNNDCFVFGHLRRS